MSYYNSSNDMARTLVQYIPCNHRVRREVLATFDTAPCVQAIHEYRCAYERTPIMKHRDFDRSVIWMDERYANNMADANMRFVRALERARSA